MIRRALVSAFLAAAAMPAVAAASNGIALQPAVGGRVVARTVVDRPAYAMYAGGRVMQFAATSHTTYTYAWPGVYFEAQFTGDSVAVRLDDDQNLLHLYLDGVHKDSLIRPGHRTVILDKLGDGPHVVRLEKAGETQDTTARFDGFTVASTEQVLPAPHYYRRMEFIGDSYMVGYGNTSHTHTCTHEEIRDTTDTSESYVTLAAKHFHAAYRILATSGHGVVRNYNNFSPGETLPWYYQFALFDKATLANDDGWVPDAVVVDLGTNDFSTPLGDDEKWKTREDLRADFIATYAVFVKSLRAKYPAAHIILMAENIGDNERIDAVNAVASRLKSDGEHDLDVLPYSGLDHLACDYHPSHLDEGILWQLLIDRLSLLPKFRLEERGQAGDD